MTKTKKPTAKPVKKTVSVFGETRLTVDGLLENFPVSRAQVFIFMDRGMPHFRFGRYQTFSEADVRRWFKSQAGELITQ